MNPPDSPIVAEIRRLLDIPGSSPEATALIHGAIRAQQRGEAERGARSSGHAMVEKDGYRVPLIGVPADAVIETCDCCGEHIGLSQAVVTGPQVLCWKCAEGAQP